MPNDATTDRERAIIEWVRRHRNDIGHSGDRDVQLVFNLSRDNFKVEMTHYERIRVGV